MNVQKKSKNSNVKNVIICLVILFFGISCHTNKNNTMKYIYADGSGNTYHITKDAIEYVPVQPEYSSSGVFSGGEKVKKSITKNEFQEIEGFIKKAVDNKNSHIEKRIMTSGLIEIVNSNSKQVYILAPDCPELQTIEKVLKHYTAK